MATIGTFLEILEPRQPSRRNRRRLATLQFPQLPCSYSKGGRLVLHCEDLQFL
jgi:hypothetical protein